MDRPFHTETSHLVLGRPVSMPSPASITDIKSELQSQLLAQTFALRLAVDGSDFSAAPLSPAETRWDDGPMEVQIAFTGSTELARSSTKVLEQALVDVNLMFRHPDNRQQNLDTCHLVAQQIRDFLVDFNITGARVENLLTPHPFDIQISGQGNFNHRLTLDLDVLRSIATVAAPEVTDTGDDAPVFTKAREAVWDAIDNWPAFAASGDTPAAWKRKFKTDEDLEELSLHDPGPAELPAIAVTWGPTSTNWWVNVMQQWQQQLFVTFWLPAHWQEAAEWRLIQLTQAIYQAAPEESPTVSYVRRAVGRPPTKNSPISLELVTLGRAQKLHAWRGTIALQLTANFDPNA